MVSLGDWLKRYQIDCKCVRTAFVAKELLLMVPMIKCGTAEQGLG